MSQAARIFVSHCHEDNQWCREFVHGLKSAGADVWYDEHNLGYGQLMEQIDRELQSRPIFMVILTSAAVASQWVRLEVQTALTLQLEQPERVVLPVVAMPCEIPAMWRTLRRITAEGGGNLSAQEAIARAAQLLALTPPGTTAAPFVGAAPSTHAMPLDSETAELLERGKSLAAQRRYGEALASYDSALQRDERQPLVHLYKAEVLRQMQRYGDALQECDRAITLDPSDARCHQHKGDVLIDLEWYEAALEACDEALRRDMGLAPAHRGRGDALKGLKRYDEALVAYDRAIELAPRDPEEYAAKASALHYDLERSDEAIALMDRAIQLDPQNDMWWFRKALWYRDQDRFPDALVLCDRAISLYSRASWPYLLKARVLMYAPYQEAELRHAEALTMTQRAISIAPDDAQGYIESGTVLMSLNRSEEAILSYDHALKLAPYLAYVQLLKASTLQRMQKLDEALRTLDEGLSLAPEDIDCLSLKGEILVDLGRPEQALSVFDRGIALAAALPASSHLNSRLWSGRAWALAKLKRFEEAIAAQSNAIHANRLSDHYAMQIIGEIHRGAGSKGMVNILSQLRNDARWQSIIGQALMYIDEDEALAALSNATRLDPNDARSWHYRGYLLYSKEMYEGAIAAYKKAIELDPEEANDSYSYIVEGLLHLKRYDEALIACSKWKQIAPNGVSPWEHEAKVLAELGRNEEALADYRTAMTNAPRRAKEFWLVSADILDTLGKTAEAAAARSRANASGV